MSQNEFIFPFALALKALKSSAYNNSAYALAEVIDNSYQAGAKNIYVAIVESNGSPKIIAVLDNGRGMDQSTLRHSIQYGNSSHEAADHSVRKLGRFGVGLMSATFNQCNRLSIWSWQDGLDGNAANMISLDTQETLLENENILPQPSEKELPLFFRKVFACFPELDENPRSGTLIVWEDFHNLSWVKSNTLLTNLAFHCGRIYRNFFDRKELDMRISVWRGEGDSEDGLIKDKEECVRPVDPMFLTDWDHKDLEQYYVSDRHSMFQPHAGSDTGNGYNEDGSPKERKFEVRHPETGKCIGTYRIIAARRRADVVEKANKAGHRDPGNAPYGKLAKKLQGVSVLREGREIMLDVNWLSPDRSIDRWMGVSIDFDASLDRYFGISNNKQCAQYLANMAHEQAIEDDNAQNDVVKNAAMEIHKLLKSMRSSIVNERKNARSRTPNNESEAFVNESMCITNAQSKKLEESIQPIVREVGIKKDTESPSDDPSMVREVYKGTERLNEPADITRAAEVVEKGIKIDFVTEPSSGSAIFNVRTSAPGLIVVVFNTSHPWCERVQELFATDDPDAADDSAETSSSPEERLKGAIWFIQKFVFSFARAECQAREKNPMDGDRYEDIRNDWGRVARYVFREDE